MFRSLLTFRGPCIVIYYYKESQRDALFLIFIWWSTVHVSDRSAVHHQEYLNTVYTQEVFVMLVLWASASVVRIHPALASRQPTELAWQMPVACIQCWGRLRLKCDGTRAETTIRLSAKRTSPSNRRGRQFSRLLAAEVCASAVVMVVMLDTPCSGVMWRVLATHSTRQFPLSLPLPCVAVCRHASTGLHSWWWTADLSETCRVLYQINLRNSASRWLLL
jgi:hypothetical protein